MEDPNITSVRLVTNPEKMVLRETQRAFVYFCLHGLTVDQVIVNRILPDEITDPFFADARKAQAGILSEIETYFAPVPVSRVPLFNREVLGYAGLHQLSDRLYGGTVDPADVRPLYVRRPDAEVDREKRKALPQRTQRTQS